jgi:hypothetical protein
MATSNVNPVIPGVSHEGGGRNDDFSLFLLKKEIQNLWRDRKRSRYELGRKLTILQAMCAHPHTGSFGRELHDMRIPIWEAHRAITFYKRAKANIEAILLQNAKDCAKWGGIEDAEDLERHLQAEGADDRLAELETLKEEEIARVALAVQKRKQTVSGYRIILSLREDQRKEFTRAWNALSDEDRTRLVYEAVTNA